MDKKQGVLKLPWENYARDAVWYGIAVTLVVLALAVVLLIDARIGSSPTVSLFFCVIIFCSWYGGRGPGLLATVLSIVAFDYYFLSPVRSFQLNVNEIPRLAIFVVSSAAVSLAVSGQRKAVDALAAARDELTASEEQMRMIVATIPTLAWTAEPDGAIVFFNERWLQYTGLTEAQARGQGWTTAIYPGDVGALTGKWNEILRSQQPGELEARVRRHDGAYHWFLSRATPLLNPHGHVVKWYGISVDIEDRKQAEETLRASEQKLRQVFDTIPGMLSTRAPDGRLEFANQHTLDYYGDEARTMTSLAPMIHPDDRERVVRDWHHSLEHGTPYQGDFRARRVDGVYRWLQSRVQPLRDSAGQIVRWYNIFIDIDEMKNLEEDLRRNRAYLTYAQELSHTGSVGIRLSDGTFFWSEESARIFGYDPRVEPNYERVMDRVHPEDAALVRAAFERAHKGEVHLDLEYRLVMPDGAIKYIHGIAHSIYASSGEEVIGAVTDITELRRTQYALQAAQAELAHITRMTTMSAMAASLAHEVNQPLTAIINDASACQAYLARPRPDLKEIGAALTEINSEAERASAIIDRVRRLAKKAPLEKARVSLKDIVDDVLALARYDFTARHVTVRTDLPENLPPVLGDRIQLQQVLLNLMVNGMDAMKAVDPAKRVLIIFGRAEAVDAAPAIVLAVRDEGTGFDPADLHRLFEAFFTTKATGMGMGLAISRSIVEAHGGKLWGEPNPTRGATFYLRLPVLPPEAAS